MQQKTVKAGSLCLWVPVVSSTGKPLMPCHPARAAQLVKAGKAKRRFKAGLFYILLTQRVSGDTQPVAAAADPGSKKEGYCVGSEKRVFVNIQADAVTWVKDAVEDRREARRLRRYRKTPCRANRKNRARGCIPPSTLARWGAKLRIFNILRRLFPISVQAIEDVKAKTKKGLRHWNTNFSPLEVGKQWCYTELRKFGELKLFEGFETYTARMAAGLKKTNNKLAETFSAHCVDAYVLVRLALGLPVVAPSTERVHLLTPIQFHRRELHRRQPGKGGVRSPYGGTRSHEFSRGSLVKHAKYGVCYVGGWLKDRISLHDRQTGKRLCQNAKSNECTFLNFNVWRLRVSSPA